jgi:hypothetical protein
MQQTYEQIEAKYGKTHTIRKWNGTKVDLTELATNQIICQGDGVNYHWLLTEKSTMIKQDIKIHEIKLNFHRGPIGKFFERIGWLNPFWIQINTLENKVKVNCSNKKMLANMVMEFKAHLPIYIPDFTHSFTFYCKPDNNQQSTTQTPSAN